MKKSPSSIFSFETLDVGRAFQKDFLLTALVALMIVVASEAIARFALVPTGDYWKYWSIEAAGKFIYYRDQVLLDRAPNVLIVGDSTAARNYDPASLEDATGRTSVFNLGWPANFPLAFEQSTIPLLEEPYAAPEIVVCSISPKAFTDDPIVTNFEASILASPIARHQRGETLLQDYCFLSRLQKAGSYVDSWFTGEGLFAEPSNQGAMLLEGKDTELRSEAEVNPLGSQISTRRLETIEKLSSVAQQRKFRLIVIVPPRTSEKRKELEDKYVSAISGRLESSGFELWDCRDVPHLTEIHFFDSDHLNRNGAQIFSKYIASRFRDATAPIASEPRH